MTVCNYHNDRAYLNMGGAVVLVSWLCVLSVELCVVRGGTVLCRVFLHIISCDYTKGMTHTDSHEYWQIPQ